MKPRRLRPLLAAVCCACSAAAPAAEPVRLIFDTDMGNDVDDALALAMIHALESRGACKLLAITVTKDHPKAAAYINAVDTWHGRPEIPIGVVKEGATREEGKFLGMVDAEDGSGKPLYPHATGELPEAVSLLRRTLAAEPDGSVTLVQVGFFTNLARLLDSPADEHSPLPGRELIGKKVKLLSLMAGAFAPIGGNPAYREYNVVQDIPAARKVAAEWPTAMTWSGFEIGIAVTYPHQSIEQDFAEHDPVKDAYYLYDPPPHDRPTWDLSSALHAIHPERGYFGLSPEGRVSVDENGATVFKEEPGGRDRYLTVDALLATRAKEAMVQLCTQPRLLPASDPPAPARKP